MHLLDVARVYFSEAETIYALTNRIHPGARAEDVATMLVPAPHRRDLHRRFQLFQQNLAGPVPGTLVHIEGPRGSIQLREGYRMTVTSDRRTREQHVTTPLLQWTSLPWHNIQESVLNTQRHWVRSVEASSR